MSKKENKEVEAETVVLTEEILAELPALAAKGWNAGEKCPKTIIDEETAKKEAAEK